MSLVSAFERMPMHPCFQGLHDQTILERAKSLNDLYVPDFVTGKTLVSLDGEDISISTYSWKPPVEDSQKRPLSIILNGIFTSGRSNDHFAKELSQKYGSDVLCFDYPGKGTSSRLKTKESYTPRMYASILRDILHTEGHKYDDIYLIGYSHGARVIFDLYNLGWDSQKIKGVVLGDMGPERPIDAAKRRASRNQHNPLFPDLTTALEKMRQFFAGHGKSLPDDFIIHVIDQNFQLTDTGNEYGVHNAYDPRSMFGYCDEVQANPSLDCWKGFHRISAPILLLLGQDTNTVLPDTLGDMIRLKSGELSLQELYLARQLSSRFTAAARSVEPSELYVLEFEGTGHYPEPHRASHSQVIGDFIQSPIGFSIKKSLEQVHAKNLFSFDQEYVDRAQANRGVIPMTHGMHDADLFDFFKREPIFPR